MKSPIETGYHNYGNKVSGDFRFQHILYWLTTETNVFAFEILTNKYATNYILVNNLKSREMRRILVYKKEQTLIYADDIN